jgi:integrase
MTKGAAERKRSRAHAMLIEGADVDTVLRDVFGDAAGPNLSLADARERYFEWAKERKRPATLVADRQRLDVIAEEPWAKGPMHRIRQEDVRRFVEAMKAKGRRGTSCSGGTANRYLSALSAVLQWAVRERYIKMNPARGIERFSEKGTGRKLYLRADQARALIAAASEAFRPLVTFALLTGCRRGEILSLRWRDVDLDKARVEVRAENSKTGEGRTIDIPADLVAALRFVRASQRVRDIRGDDNVFQLADGRAWTGEAVRHHFEAARSRCKDVLAENAGVRFHDLRHTYASFLVHRGQPIQTVSRILGHRSLHMTMRYAHLYAEDRQRAAVAVGEELALGKVEAAKGTSGGTNGA